MTTKLRTLAFMASCLLSPRDWRNPYRRAGR